MRRIFFLAAGADRAAILSAPISSVRNATGLPLACIENRRVVPICEVEARESLRHHELQFGAVEPDAIRP